MEDIFRIVRWFSHAHENNVSNLGQTVYALDFLGKEQLGKDFVRCQRTHLAHSTRGTESASCVRIPFQKESEFDKLLIDRSSPHSILKQKKLTYLVDNQLEN